MTVIPTSRLFKMFYLFHFHPRDSPIVVDLPRVKNWKDKFIQLKHSDRIRVSIK